MCLNLDKCLLVCESRSRTEQSTHLDFSSQHVYKGLPFQILWELAQSIPLLSERFRAVRVLLFFDLPGVLISADQLQKRVR